MPNPGKPAEVKRMIGSRHYKPTDPLELEQVSETPEPLRRLDESGLMLWNRVWSMGQTWISVRTDVELLQMTCEMLDERDGLRSYLLEQPDAWHERKALREVERLITSNLSLLGFTPTDRSKLGVAEVKKQSKLDELMAKRDAL